MLIVQPPKPPPIIRAPITALSCFTSPTIMSSSAQLTSYNLLSPLCVAYIFLPNAFISFRCKSRQAESSLSISSTTNLQRLYTILLCATYVFNISMLTSLKLCTCGRCCCTRATPSSHCFLLVLYSDE